MLAALKQKTRSVLKSFLADPPATIPTAWKRGDEISYAYSYLHGGFNRYNPDDLIGRKGLQIYGEIARDPQVSACLEILNHATLSPGFGITPPDFTEGTSNARRQAADEHARFIKFTFDEMSGDYLDKIGEILSARVYGFSLSEIVYNQIKYGEFTGLVGIQDIKTRHPLGIDFQVDDFGNLQSVLQANKPLDARKFIIYSHKKQFANFYGNSDLRPAYGPWWMKTIVQRFMSIALERHATPIPVFTPETGVNLNDAALGSLQSFIANLQVKTGIILPRGVKLDFADPSPRTAEAFIPALKWLDEQIRIALLVPGLMGLSGEQATGSLARSGTEFDVFLWIVSKLRRDIECLHDERLIKPLLDMNYDISDGLYPRFKFNAITEEHKQKIFDNWLKGIQGGALTDTLEDENKARELIGFDPIDEESFDAGREARQQKSNVLPFRRKKYSQQDRADFAAIKEALDNETQSYEDRIRETLTSYEDAVIAYAENNLATLKPKQITDFELTSSDDLQSELQDFLTFFYERGRDIGLGELPAKIRKSIKPSNLAYELGGLRFYQLDEQSRATEVRLIKQYGIGPGFAPKEALKAFESRAWLIKSVIDDDIISKARFELFKHYEGGRTQAETIGRLRTIFEPWIGDAGKIADDQGNILQAFRLENIVRTESGYALNQGRAALANEAKDYVSGVEISAILDDRTTQEICQKANGLRVSVNHESYAKILPPLHWQCRSTILYITTDEPADFSSDAEIDAVVRSIPAEFK